METQRSLLLATARETLDDLDKALTPLGPESKAEALHLVVALMLQTLTLVRAADGPALAATESATKS